MTKEVFKDVVGYEGIYVVSNLGNVKRISGLKYCNIRYRDGYILKPKDNGKGYLRVKLSNNGKSKRVMLHRIIAQAFIDNPKNKPFVNHINRIEKRLMWLIGMEQLLSRLNLK